MDDEGNTRQPVQILGQLQIACAKDSPASLSPAHMPLSCAGRLHSATAEGVVVEIPNPPEGELLGSMAIVSYSSGHATVSFVGEIIGREGDGEGHRVTLSIPDVLQSENRRAAVRVPVPRGTMEAVITEGPIGGRAQVVDMSLLGMLIEVGAEDSKALRKGDTLTMTLSVGSVQLSVDAEIRRQAGRRFGLKFLIEGRPPKKLGVVMWRIQEARREVAGTHD